ncbi:MAG: SGNH/GDSL hydrolase family protein [Armatimonadetes bacterium]|nr:SGNH/GDSL hydrolase family protein [Armatimonadota bacterium]
MTWANLITTTSGIQDSRGVNLVRGLDRWRMGLGAAAKTDAGVGQGGVDVVLLGDSIAFGFKSNQPYYDGWFHRLKLRLQERFNPVGVGGYGFMRASVTADRKSPTMTYAGTVTDQSAADGGGGGVAVLPSGAAKANRVIFQFDGSGTPVAANRTRITDAEILYAKWPNGNPDAVFDLGTIDPAGGSGNLLANQVMDGSAGSASFGFRALLNGLVPTRNHFLQIASGPTSGSAGFGLEGVIAYDGDYDCGVRCHNVAFPSASTNWVGANSIKVNSNIVRWSSNGAGATKAKLFIIALGANDMGTGASASVSATQYEANLELMVSTAVAQPSKPSVMLLIHPLRCDGGGGQFARTTNHPNEYIAAAYRVASRYPDCCVVDLQRYVGIQGFYSSASDNSFVAGLGSSGWNHADLVHYTDKAQLAIANLLANILTS